MQYKWRGCCFFMRPKRHRVTSTRAHSEYIFSPKRERGMDKACTFIKSGRIHCSPKRTVHTYLWKKFWQAWKGFLVIVWSFCGIASMFDGYQLRIVLVRVWMMFFSVENVAYSFRWVDKEAWRSGFAYVTKYRRPRKELSWNFSIDILKWNFV